MHSNLFCFCGSRSNKFFGKEIKFRLYSNGFSSCYFLGCWYYLKFNFKFDLVSSVRENSYQIEQEASEYYNFLVNYEWNKAFLYHNWRSQTLFDLKSYLSLPGHQKYRLNLCCFEEYLDCYDQLHIFSSGKMRLRSG